MPNRFKQKGDRAERALVDIFRAKGLDAYRVPLSGSAGGFKQDVEVRLADQTLRVESKVRKAGFSLVYKYLADADLLVIQADRKEGLAVISLGRLARLLATIAHNQAQKDVQKPVGVVPPDLPSPQPKPTPTQEPPRDLLTTVGAKINTPRFTPILPTVSCETSKD